MLIFLVALQSPAASKDWSRVSRLCERTLRSICQQTSDAFRVIVACNQRPDIDFTHRALTIVEDDFPLPQDAPGRMLDKWLKVKRCLVAAHDDGPAHIMITDADDCVHRGLAALVEANPDCHGWNFETGYLHDAGSRTVFILKKFDRYCGTSGIVRLDAQEFPRKMSDPTEDYFVLWNGHGVVGDYLAERGRPLRRLPFIGAIYNSDTGENHTDMCLRRWRSKKMLLKKLLYTRPLTRSMRRDFGLYELDLRCC